MNDLPNLASISAAAGGGDWARAERLVEAELSAFPLREDLLVMHAVSLQMQNKTADAIAAYAKLTQLFPQSEVHWGNYASALREADLLEQALHAQEESVRLAPDDAFQLVNLAQLLQHQHDYLAARDIALRAQRLHPGSARVCIAVARTHAGCLDKDAAAEALRSWRTWLPLDDSLQRELADLLLLVGDGHAALALLGDRVRRAPESLDARVRLASACERLNRLQEAEEAVAGIGAMNAASRLDAAPDIRVELAHVLSRFAQRKGDLAEARAMLEGAGPRDEHDFPHYFVLSEVCEKQGDVDATMQALATAHTLQADDIRQLVPQRFEPDAVALPVAAARVSAAEYRAWPPLDAPDARGAPIFIVGFPRSGTTLLEQMLDAHPALQSMDENPFFNKLFDMLAADGIFVPEDLHRLDQRDCDELRKRYVGLVCATIDRNWNAQLVDKNPLNMLWLPLIHRLFPRARFILALRHPCDVVLSCYMQNFHSGLLAAASRSLEKLATSYVEAMQCWLHHSEIFKPDTLAVRYEDTVADLAAQASRIGTFLELDDTTPLLRFDEHARNKGFIATPSYSQVVQPINTKGLDRWHRYRDHLAPVLPILEPMIEHWGYSSTIDV